MLAIQVAHVTAPRWSGRKADLERGVDALQAAEDAFVLRPSQAVPDQLEKLRRDSSDRRAVVRIAREAHVLTCRGRTPRLDSIVPVVRDGSQMAGGDVLASFVRKLGRNDEGGDAGRER
jgi:hypothetical protein